MEIDGNSAKHLIWPPWSSKWSEKY